MNKLHRAELMLSIVTLLVIVVFAFIVSLNTESLVMPLQAQNGVQLTQTPSAIPPFYASILNGGFERVEKRGMPKNWDTSALKTGDRVRCDVTERPDGKPDLIYAHAGKCAFQFIGKLGSKSTLAQTIAFNGFESGQEVQITAYVKGHNVPAGAAKFGLVAVYNSLYEFNLKLDEGTYDYTPVTFTRKVHFIGTLKNLKFRVKYTGDVGKLLVDQVRVEALPLPTFTSTPTAFPTNTPTETATETPTIRPTNTPFGQPPTQPGSGGE